MLLQLTKTTTVAALPSKGRVYFGPFEPGDVIESVEISAYGNGGSGGLADVSMALFSAVPATADDTAANFEANPDQLVGGDYTGPGGKAIKINGISPSIGNANTAQYEFQIRRKVTPQAAVLGLQINHGAPNSLWLTITVNARPATGDVW